MTYSKKSRRAAGLATVAVLMIAGVSAESGAFASPAGTGTPVSVLEESSGLSAEFEDRTAAKVGGGTVIPVTVSGGTVGATAAAFATLRIAAKVGGLVAKVTWVDESHLKVVAPATTKATAATMQLFSKGVAGPESSSVVAYSPTVASVLPVKTSAAGGATVTITGAGFLGVDTGDQDAVTFGGVAATSFTVVSAIRITAVVPAGAAGATAVTVRTTGGANEESVKAGITYVAPLAVDVSGKPAFRASGGPLILQVTGGTLGATAKEFATARITVLMGKRPLSGTYVDETHVRILAPASNADTAQFSISRDGIVGEAAEVTVSPVVTALSAKSDTLGGGARVTVRVAGGDVTAATDFTFGANPAECVRQGSGTQVSFVCVAPPATEAGPVQVGFTSSTGKVSHVTAAATFSYTDN